MVINIFNLTVEILFVVDVGQLNLTRLVGAYLSVYMCNAWMLQEKARLYFRVGSLCLNLSEIMVARRGIIVGKL